MKEVEIKEESDKHPFIRGGFDHGRYISYVFVEKNDDNTYTPKLFSMFETGYVDNIILHNGDRRVCRFNKEKAIEVAKRFVEYEKDDKRKD